VRYLTKEEVLTIHYMVMDIYGESEQAGLLFKDRFFFAVERPAMCSFGQAIYPTLWLKAGAFVQSLVQGHCFRNGNKRTTFACLNIFLKLNGYLLKMSTRAAEAFMIDIVTKDTFKQTKSYLEISKILKLTALPHKK
jgi:death-on-curing protein